APERSRTCSAPSSFASRPRGCGNPTRTTSRSRRRRRITGAEVLPLPEPRPEERPVLVVDLGGQYAQLIARRVREARVYSELVPHTITAQQVRARRPHALILSGGPASVYADGAPRMDADVLKLGVPTLGICYGMQFHPEVVHTPHGQEVLKNFLFRLAGAPPAWTPAAVIEEQVERIREQVGRERVLCALSGGVDSAVAALLVHKAVGDQLTCVL